MNKKRLLVLGVVVIVLVWGVSSIPWLIETEHIKIGAPKGDFITLANGSYALKDIDLAPGRYGIYAVKGTGRVSIDAEEWELDSSLFKDIENDGDNIPRSFNLVILYRESPKAMLTDDSVIIVNGDTDFTLGFVQH